MKVRSKDTGGHIDGLSEADAQELIDGGDYEAAEEEPKPKKAAAATRPEKPKAAARKSKRRGA